MRTRVFWFGLIGGVIVSLLIGLFALPVLGVFSVSASGKTGLLDWWGDTNLTSSLKWRAPKAAIPSSAKPVEGLEHYAAMCVECHGAPGIRREEWAQHLQPAPPDLWKRDTQSMKDGELFYVVRNGLKMTGMPAFGPSHSDPDIWNIVAFVRKLNTLTDTERSQLRQHLGTAHGEGEHGQTKSR